jgi:WbqC-like protein family
MAMQHVEHEYMPAPRAADGLCVGIVQSSYIPWRGYFDLVDDVDLLIFLDDVKYSHGSWRNRNSIKTPRGREWLSVPVMHDSATLIQDAEVDYRHRWIDRHIASLKQNYSRAPFFKSYSNELFDLLSSRPRTISELNVALTHAVMRSFDIRTPTRMSREFRASGKRLERVLALLAAAGASSYLSGPTAKVYIEPTQFAQRGLGLAYKSYVYEPYPQRFGPFEGQVTALDLLFNCGPQARGFLKSRAGNELVVPQPLTPE